MQTLEMLGDLAEGKALSVEQAEQAFEAIMEGLIPEVQIAAFLTALRVRGESLDELYAAAKSMRARVVPWGGNIQGLLDTCGTGGDYCHTFNISTVTAIVAASCGIPVAKHGNRGVSSPSGSAEVLNSLGVNLELSPSDVRECVEQVGIAFFFAPHWHPAMKNVMPVRKQLKFRTIFNLLGPLSNPAGADYQLLGVGKPEWTERLAATLAKLGTRSATVVTGSDGLDEVTLSGETTAACVRNGDLQTQLWTPETFGLPASTVDDWKVSSPEESAEVITAILEGKTGPCRDIVLANTAAALWTAEKVGDLKQGVEKAQQVIDSGKAFQRLKKLVEFTQRRCPKE